MMRSKAALPIILLILLLPSLMFARRPDIAFPGGKPDNNAFAPIETPPNPFRTYLWLDGRWRFDANGEQRFVRVPHSWNRVPGLEAKPGPFRYRLRFSAPVAWRESDARLHFRGVAATARVSLNGKPVGSHSGRYTPFSFEVGPLLRYGKPNDLLVEVDAREPGAPHRAFGPDADGGLFREVYLERAPRSRFDSVRIVNSPDDVNGARIDITADARLAPNAVALVMGRVESRDDIRSLANFEAKITADADGRAVFRWNASIPDLRPWSVQYPRLYRASLVIVSADGMDGYSATFGARDVDWSGDRVRLNGRPLRLRGAVRYPDMPGSGIVETDAAMSADIAALRDAGLNAVLLPSPPHPRFLDLCDESGLLVIESLPVFIPAGSGRGGAAAIADEQLRELVERDVNHPSILAWAVRVTGDPSPEELRYIYKRLSEMTALLDARPLLMEPWYAGKRPAGDIPALLMRADMADPDAAAEILRLRAAKRPVIVIAQSPWAAAGRIGLDGRLGAEADQLGALRVFEQSVRDSQPAGWFLESLADRRLSSAALGPAPFIAADGLLDLDRRPKAAYDWLRLPGARGSGFELRKTIFPYDPPTSALFLWAVCLFMAFALWSGFGELRTLFRAPWRLPASFAAPVELLSSDDAALSSGGPAPHGPPIASAFLRRGLPILVCSAVGVSLAAGAFLQCHTLNLDAVNVHAAVHLRRALLDFLPRTWLVFAALLGVVALSASGSAFIAQRPFQFVFESLSRCVLPLVFAPVALFAAPSAPLFSVVLLALFALSCAQSVRAAIRILPSADTPELTLAWVAASWILPAVCALMLCFHYGAFDFLP